MIEKIGLGGGCHWCTEAVFQSLKGVKEVEQGWLWSSSPYDTPSEGVLIHYDPDIISLRILIQIHLLTHSSSSEHSMREKYRSAVYAFNEKQGHECTKYLSKQAITLVLPFVGFKKNAKRYLNYYQKNKNAPFCDRFIKPKLDLLRERYKEFFV